VVSLIEHLSINYLKTDANLSPSDIDFKRLRQIKHAGKLLILFSGLLSFYMGFLILENWIVGILLGLCFTVIYINFYLILLATIRKSDFIKHKKVITLEKNILVNGVNLIGDLKTYDENNKSSRMFYSFVIRLLFLIILSSFLSISTVLLIHKNAADKGASIYREKSIERYGQFLKKSLSFKKKKSEDLLALKTQRLNYLNFKRDSLTKLLIFSPADIVLKDEIKWVTNDIDAFNKDEQNEIVYLRNEINRYENLFLEKTTTFKKNISSSIFLIQRINYLKEKHLVSAILVFFISLAFCCLPFILRLRMLQSLKYTMDDKLEEHTKRIIEKGYNKLEADIREVTKNNLYQSFLNKYKLQNWPLQNDYFENPPFNTIPKLDNRIKLRKGSLGTYLNKS